MPSSTTSPGISGSLDGFHIIQCHPELLEDERRVFQRADRLNATLPMEILLRRMAHWRRRFPVNIALYRSARRRGPVTAFIARRLSNGAHVPGSGEMLAALTIPSPFRRLRFFLETIFPSRVVMGQLFGNRRPASRWHHLPRRIASLAQIVWRLLKSLAGAA